MIFVEDYDGITVRARKDENNTCVASCKILAQLRARIPPVACGRGVVNYYWQPAAARKCAESECEKEDNGGRTFS